MSKIPYRFIPIPQYFDDLGLLDDPKTERLARFLFKRCRTEQHTAFIEGKTIILDPFEFIFGRETVATACGLSGKEVWTRMERWRDSNLVIMVDSKKHIRYSVYRWMTENFCENRVQHKAQQEGQHQDEKKYTKGTARGTQTKSVEAKTLDVDRTFVSVGALATAVPFFSNSEAPPTSFPRIDLPPYIAEGLEIVRKSGFSKFINSFLFADGSKPHPDVLKRWISWYTEETVVIAMIWIVERERIAKIKGRPCFSNPEAYLERGLRDCLWEKEEIQNQAKIIDLNQAKRHKRS